MFNSFEARKLILDDFENKKIFEANRTFKCALCRQEVYVGDEFVFMGRMKACKSCHIQAGEMIREAL